MSDTSAATPPLVKTTPEGIGRTLRLWGGIAFWTQIFVAVIPVIVITIAFSSVYGVQAPIRSAGFMGAISLASFVILLITTWWFWSYRKLGRAMAEGSTKIARPRLERRIWIGLALSCAGVVLSMAVLFVEMTYLLIRFLEAPQGGVPVIQTVQGETSWISAVDILGLMTVVLTLTAEIVVMVGGLWLLSRVMMLKTGDAP